jgi:hypothetical protein
MDTERIAVFVSPGWTDDMRLRVWAKSLRPDVIVLLTDDPSEGNVVLMRQLKCSDTVCLIARIPGTMRSIRAVVDGKRRRDETMVSLATRVVDFGDLPGGSERFVGRQTLVILERGE